MRMLPCGLEVVDVDHLVRLDVDVYLRRLAWSKETRSAVRFLPYRERE